jgi:hypothetical protein
MSPPEAMAAARAAGVQIAIDGADLVLEASGPPPDAILDLLTRYKLGIVALLQSGRDGWPAQIEPVDADAIEERAGLAADRVPARYLDTWARLQCQLPSYAPVDTWQRAIEDRGRFLDLWGTDAAAMRWTAGELFDVPRHGRPGGLVWQLKGERVGTLGEVRARLTHGRMIKRQVRT